jgi:hypothetical protein
MTANGLYLSFSSFIYCLARVPDPSYDVMVGFVLTLPASCLPPFVRIWQSVQLFRSIRLVVIMGFALQKHIYRRTGPMPENSYPQFQQTYIRAGPEEILQESKHCLRRI